MTNLVLFHRTLAAAARAVDLLTLLSADGSDNIICWWSRELKR